MTKNVLFNKEKEFESQDEFNSYSYPVDGEAVSCTLWERGSILTFIGVV